MAREDDKVLRPLPGPENLALWRQTRDRLLGSNDWQTLSSLANGAIPQSILTTRGDIIYRNATTAARLAKGTSGQFLKQGADDPAWTTFTLIDLWSWFIQSPEDGDLDLIINCPYAATINSVTTDCTAGTATLTGKINTTALGGTANSVSTTEQEQTHSSDNAVAIGDNFRITLASVSGCENLTVTVKITRTL